MTSSNKTAARVDNIAGWLGGNRLETSNSTSTTTILGVATSNSKNGKVNVIISDNTLSGDNAGTAQEIDTNIQVLEGDSVQITLTGSAAMKAPTVTGIIGGGDRTAEGIRVIQQAAAEAEKLAKEAKDAVGAEDQYFFDDDNGIHVATKENDANTGPNLLANSVGILMRDGTVLRTAMTPSGFAVYDGRGNEEGNVIALFSDATTIGKTGENQVMITGDAIDFFNQDGIISHIGSVYAEDPNGVMRYIPYYNFGDGGSEQLNQEHGSIVVGAECEAGTYSQAMGVRCKATGALSTAIGIDNDIKTSNTHALGAGLTMATGGGLVLGTYNDSKKTGTLVTIGDGTENARHTMLTMSKGTLDLCGSNITVINGHVLNDITKKDAARFAGSTNSGWCSYIKTGHVVKVKTYVTVKYALASYSVVNMLFTGLPPAAIEDGMGLLKIDNSTGTVFGQIDTNGNFNVQTRETSLAAGAVLYGSFTYISSE